MTTDSDRPPGPAKSPDAFRTIGEVARELGLPQHVLRFWELKFSHVSPMKRAGGRRYYRPDDIALLDQIRNLLHNEGYTIKGVQKLLRQNGGKSLLKVAATETVDTAVNPSNGAPRNKALMDTIHTSIAELEGVRSALRDALKMA